MQEIEGQEMIRVNFKTRYNIGPAQLRVHYYGNISKGVTGLYRG